MPATKKQVKYPETTKSSRVLKTSSLKNILGLIIALFAILLYVQSVSFKFAADDETILTSNSITKEGIRGIPTILTKDYWYGYQDSIRVPEYRPTSLVMFATEWQVYKDNPHYYHAVNILLYAIICWLIFILLCRLFNNQNLLFPFICALLFTAHPIHTEVVDYIKSADELLCFLFALLSVLFLLKSLDRKSDKSILKTEGSRLKSGHNTISNASWLPQSNPYSMPLLILAGVSYFFCLLSKETGIVYVIIVPLLLYIFTGEGIKKIITLTGMYAAVIIVSLVIRHQVLVGIRFTDTHNSLNNSLWAAPDFISQKATAFYILLRYVLLLLFPHPLSYDYSFATIPVFHVSDPAALLAILLYLALGLYTFLLLRNFNRKKIATEENKTKGFIAFAILFYLLTLLPVSNLIFLIGSSMAERFLFEPSLGFTMMVTAILFKIINRIASVGLDNNISMEKSARIFGIPTPFSTLKTQYLLATLFIIVTLYSAKTFIRSRNWMDNYTLYKHDITIAAKSAVAHYNYGDILLFQKFHDEKNDTLKPLYLEQAIIEFSKALEYFPNFPKADFYLGQAYMDKDDVVEAIKHFDVDLANTRTPRSDLFAVLQWLYTKPGKSDKLLIEFTKKALSYYPDYPGANFYLGTIYMYNKDIPNAIKYYEIVVKNLQKPDVTLYYNLGTLYNSNGNFTQAINMFDSAIKYSPNYTEAYINKAQTSLKEGKNLEAIAAGKKVIEIAPGMASGYRDVGYAYFNLKEYTQALEYLKKAVTLDSLDPQAISVLGFIYQITGNPGKGQQLMDKAKQMNAISH